MKYYSDDNFELFLDDSFEKLKEIKEKSVDMIFADPPYFLSSDGFTCSGGKKVSVNKGDWDKTVSLEEKHEFNRKWISLCKRVLKDNGTLWISGTMHNIYSVGMALEQEGFKIINNITWRKTNPPPNLSCRYFVHSTETVLWAKLDIPKAKHIFNYDIMRKMNGNKQDKDVWSSPVISTKEKIFGKHPTQKPLWLLEKIILASTEKDAVILDPFNGSGTTGIAARKLGRKYIGIDNVEEYLGITVRRLEELNHEKKL